MNLIINHSSMEPIYEQLSRQFRALISTGQMKEGEPLPSVRALAKELRISALTVKKAYDDLEHDPRKGAYNPLKALSQQPGYEEEMKEIFELLLAQCAQSFERLPCVEDADLLRNILYSGVWLKYNCKTAKQARSRG